MKIVTEHEVTCCANCPHSTNAAREWDDPFTSPPADPDWWCTHPDKKESHIYSKEVHKKVADDCPVVRAETVKKGAKKASCILQGKDITPEEEERFTYILGGGDCGLGDQIRLIKTCLITKSQRQWLFDQNLELYDVLRGHTTAEQKKRIRAMTKNWNKKVGRDIFFTW